MHSDTCLSHWLALAVSLFSVQHHKQALEVFVEVLLTALQNYPLAFHWLYGTSDCFTLTAHKCITAISKTLELAILATPKWKRIRNICQSMLNVYYDSGISAHSILPWWSQPHMHVTCFSKLSCLLCLHMWLNISWNIEGYFLTCSETWISFYLFAQSSNMHRHNWERHEGCL